MIVIEVRAVLLREATGDGLYTFVAQCLDHDLAVQGGTPDRALYLLGLSLVSNFSSAIERNQGPFSNLKPAPLPYWDLLATAKHTVTRREDMPSSPQTDLKLATSITYAEVEWPESPEA